MAATWPQSSSMPEGSGAGRPRPIWAYWAIAVMGATFVVAPLVSSHPYLPFLLIALVGLVTIVDPSVGLAAVLLTIPVQEAWVVPFIRNELTFTQIATWGLLLGWAVTFYRYRLWLDSVIVGFLAIFGAFSLSLVQMDALGLWVGEVYRWLAAAAIYVIARGVLERWEDVRNVLYGMALGVAGLFTYEVISVARNVRAEEIAALEIYRAIGTFQYPNPPAAYMEMVVPLFVVLAAMGFHRTFRQRIGKTLWLASFVVSGLGLAFLLLTQSRGGIVGMAGALVVIFFLLPTQTKILATVFAAVVGGVVLLSPAGEVALERFSDAVTRTEPVIRNAHAGTWGREAVWKAGIAMIEDKPLTGVGAGEYDYHYREYVPEWVDRAVVGQAHNGWLQLGAQAGIPGIVAFNVWLFASFAALVGAARRATDDLGRYLAWGALAVFVAFTLHSLVDYLNVLSLGIQLSAVTAVGLALAPDPLRSTRRRHAAVAGSSQRRTDEGEGR